MSKISEIARLLDRRAEEFAIHVIGSQPTSRGRNEIRFGASGRIRVWIAGSKMGRYYDFGGSDHGDMIDFCMNQMGIGRAEAFAYAKQWLGIDDQSPPISLLPHPIANTHEEDRAQEQKRLRTASIIWRKSENLSDEAKLYLKNRAITETSSAWLRSRVLSTNDLKAMKLDPELADNRRVVALVFGATNDSGEICAVQQILTVDGLKASFFSNPKRTNGLMRGSAVKLDEVNTQMILAEGPETALSIRQGLHIPTWIALGTSNLTNIAMPESVKEVALAVDLDPTQTGLISCLRAASHFDSKNIIVRLLFPADPASKEKIDFNDIHQQGGVEAIQACWPGIQTKKPGISKDLLVVVVDALDGLAAWVEMGATIRVGRIKDQPGINPDSHFDASFKDILVIAPELDATAWQNRNPETRVRFVQRDAGLFYRAWQQGLQDIFFNSDNQAIFYNAESIKDNDWIVVCQTRASADLVCNRAGIAFEARKAEQYPWHLLRGKHVILAPSYSETGMRGAAIAAKILREFAAEIRVIEWPRMVVPKEDGGVRARDNPLPAHYDLAMAVSEGWTGALLEQLLAGAILLVD